MWAELEYKCFHGVDAKERVEARRQLDTERVRLYNLDRQNGSSLLLAWTIECRKGFDMSAAEVEIDDGIPPPPAEPVAPKRRGRPAGGKNAPKAAVAKTTGLLAAVEFVAIVQNDVLQVSKFATLAAGTISAYSNILAAGYPIEEELTLAPNIDKLKAALSRCGKSLAITESNGQLSIKGDKLRATVPCLAELPPAMLPDMPLMTGDYNIIKEAFKACATVADEGSDRPMFASILLEANTVTATNGQVLLQYYHGIQLPPAIVLPILFAKKIAASKLNITGFGGNQDATGRIKSFTVWFENGAWIKTQCFEDGWQKFDHLFKVTTAPPVPPELFEAIASIEAFCGDRGAVFFSDGQVASHREENVGAVYTVNGLTGGKVFHAKLIRQVSPYVQLLDIISEPDRGFFFGGDGSIRGVFMGMSGQ